MNMDRLTVKKTFEFHNDAKEVTAIRINGHYQHIVHIDDERQNIDYYLSGATADKLAAYEDTGIDPDQISAMMAHNTALIEQLADYEEAEENGTLYRLPCAIGSTVYRIEEFARNPVIEMKVLHISVFERSCFIYCMAEDDQAASCYPDHKIGTLLFLDRKEAENAIKCLR